MTTRLEDRFGEIASLGTTYTIVGAAVPASPAATWNVLVHMANRHASATIKVRLYIADTSWSSNEPAGGTLKVALAYDVPIAPGDVVQISGVIMKTTEKLVARSDTASSLDISAHGVAIT